MRTGTELNEYGTPVAAYKCDTCGNAYTVCPIPENDEEWNNCLVEECASYDPKRDIDWMFPDDPKVTPIIRPVGR